MHDAILIATMQNCPGVLARIAAMFHRRGINIHSLTVGPTADASVSEMIVRASAAPRDLERLALAIEGMVDVHGVVVQPARPRPVRRVGG